MLLVLSHHRLDEANLRETNCEGMWFLVRIPALSLTLRSMERPQQASPGPLETQAPEMVKDRLPRRKVGGQTAPRTVGAEHRKDRLEDRRCHAAQAAWVCGVGVAFSVANGLPI
jgi:hypothetical protein